MCVPAFVKVFLDYVEGERLHNWNISSERVSVTKGYRNSEAEIEELPIWERL